MIKRKKEVPEPQLVDPRLQAEIPEALRAQLDPDDEVRFCLKSDMLMGGSFGECFLVMLKESVVVLGDPEGPRLLGYKEISECEIEEVFGGGRVIAKTDDGPVRLIAFSRNLIPEFTAGARLVDQLSDGKEPVVPELEGAAFSQRAGVPLAERGGRSPLDVPRWEILLRFYKYISPYRMKIVVLTLGILVSVIAQMALPFLTKLVVDDVLNQGNIAGRDVAEAQRQLGIYSLMMVGAVFVMLMSRLVGNTAKSWLSGRLTADLREQLHAKMQKLTMSYHNHHESGQLIGRVMGDTGQIQHFLVDGLPFLFVNVLQFVFIASVLLYLHPLLALFVFVPVPLLAGGGAWFWRRLIPLFHKRGNRTSRLHSILGESIRGVKTVKALGQEKVRHEDFSGRNESLFKVAFGVDRTFIRFFEIMALFMGIATACVWYFGGRSILDPASGFTFGDLIAFIFYAAMFYGPLQWFTAVVNWMTNAFASMERILEVLDKPEEVYESPDAIALSKVEGNISFDDVRFSYDRGKEIIRGISFNIAAGEMVGLVGKSGAGKSTLINLICRFYDVDSGAIRIDGEDLRDVRLGDWRRQIGIVMQDPFLFHASIQENIAFGHPEATFEDIMRAARAARAHEFILQKDEAYDTVVGEGGVDLSGGEKQRIAIARAILHDPPVLILDEATSAVDAETEKAIQEAIATLVKGRTTIAIAHRLATLRNANRLLVIKDGRLMEQGTHEELLALEDGHFARLVKIQEESNKVLNAQRVYSE